jgi:xanthine dehydrogenase YagT iron-sulfur-binding subunit
MPDEATNAPSPHALPAARADLPPMAAAAAAALDEPVAEVPVSLTVNGQPHALRAPADQSLLGLLREALGLRGTKLGCEHGGCGACTVLLDGRRVLGCLTLAASVDGASVTTVEGLEHPDTGPSPLQLAFAACDALQCGYCTPGQLMAATGLLAEGVPPQPAAVAEAMSGNLCRCGAYPQIVQAVLQVMDRAQPTPDLKPACPAAAGA